ncbi:MAG: hypothetical protein RIB78_03250 [Gammaproteobacteria bacterium]
MSLYFALIDEVCEFEPTQYAKDMPSTHRELLSGMKYHLPIVHKSLCRSDVNFDRDGLLIDFATYISAQLPKEEKFDPIWIWSHYRMALKDRRDEFQSAIMSLAKEYEFESDVEEIVWDYICVHIDDELSEKTSEFNFGKLDKHSLMEDIRSIRRYKFYSPGEAQNYLEKVLAVVNDADGAFSLGITKTALHYEIKIPIDYTCYSWESVINYGEECYTEMMRLI